MMNSKAVIFGIKGHKLSRKEKNLFKKVKPWGIILFSRNIKNIPQLKSLIYEIKKILNNKKYPILIDVEGGKISRLNNFIDLSSFSQSYFGQLYNKDKKLFLNHYKIFIDTICNVFREVGVNINASPVLDVKRINAHNVIGSRSFSEKANKVFILGQFCINFHNKNKIATIIKHIPGHGLSKVDSHHKTPIINANKRELIKKDFKAFKGSKSFFAMTAHAIYSKYDSENVATHSRIIISKIIRKYINFKGILISDDISMKALRYDIKKNAILALKAGCNLVLHCNGNIKEMTKLGKVIPKIDNFTRKKTSHFYKFLG